MDKSLDRIRRFFSWLNLGCAIVGASLLFFIAAIICFEVLARALGGSSRLWVIEVSEYSLLFITFLGAPYLLEKNMHVVLDLVYDSFSRRPRILVQLFNSGIGLLVCVVLTIVGVQVVLDQLATGTREVTVMRPLSWWITASLPIGSGLMSFQFLDKFIRSLRGEVL